MILVAILMGCGPSSPAVVTPPVGAKPSAPLKTPWLRDVSADSGIDHVHRNGEESDLYTLLESLGGGVGLIDYDRDGLLDVILPGGGSFAGNERILGRPTKLYRNLGNLQFADVTEQLGFAHAEFYTHGCAVADYDRDGWSDVLITGYNRLALLRNEQGRRFVDATVAAGLVESLWSSSAAWGDLNGDGLADLYVCHYADWSLENNVTCEKPHAPQGHDVCGPVQFSFQPHSYYLNQGDGTFRDACSEHSLRGDGYGLGVVVCDVNADGRPDIYVANDASENHLYLNDRGALHEQAAAAGVAVDEDGLPDGSMGVDAADYDNSGRPALWVTNFEDELHALYANLGKGVFRHESKAAGIAALGRKYVGFGTSFVDFDNDGWEDIMIANGHVFRHPVKSPLLQHPLLLRNVARGTRRFFANESELGGEYFARAAMGRGLAVGDLNNDGWPDVVVSHTNAPVAVLQNVAVKSSNHHWLGVELRGRAGRDIVGTSLTLQVGEKRLTRFVKGGGSYLSSGDRRILFGLGSDKTPGRLTIAWSWGESQSFEDLACDRYYRVDEGQAEPESIAPPPQ